MHLFWIVALVFGGLVVGFLIFAFSYEKWTTSKMIRERRARNERLLAHHKAERENRAFSSGHDSGVYGDYIPVDPDTGEPIRVTRPDRIKLTTDQFKQEHRRPGNLTE
ncbi:hypothetical protein BS618_29340 [Rhodococcus erythropolis]|nr:hypothetical protein RHOER0001_5507 [Rhodococcus erythropolis SK121]OKA10749.1 hypothetical protein BS618_29340 [Rhodococcus erythropolis]REK80965.1 hypothetical protein DVG80_16490 [Rhodococcus erythropolis]